MIRILLKNGISFGVFADVAKRVFVDVAEQDFRLEGRKQSDSRISVLTGLNRKDVAQVRGAELPDDKILAEKSNRATRVISGWLRDPLYSDSRGEVAELPLEGEPSFSSLVKKYSGDTPVKAILAELLRVGTVAETGEGRLKLVTRGYIPTRGKEEKLHLLGSDAADMFSTFDHNLENEGEKSFLQLKVCYDNLPVEVMQKLRKLAKFKGHAFLEDFDQWLSTHDRDGESATLGTGRKRAGIGIYYFEEDFQEKEQ